MSRSLLLKSIAIVFSVSVLGVTLSGCGGEGSEGGGGQMGPNTGQPPVGGGYPNGSGFPQGVAPQKIVVRYYAQSTCYTYGNGGAQPYQAQNGYNQQYPFQGPTQNTTVGPQYNQGRPGVEYAYVGANTYGANGTQYDVNTMVNQNQLQFMSLQGNQMIQSSFPYTPNSGSAYFLQNPSQQYTAVGSANYSTNGYNNGYNQNQYNQGQNYVRASCGQQVGYYSYQNYCPNQQYSHYYYSVVNYNNWSYLPTYFWQNSYYYYIPETWFCSSSYMYLVYKAWW